MKKLKVDVEDGYEPLLYTLVDALEQAQAGKGKERHATMEGVFQPFDRQSICEIGRMVGTGFNIGQAIKKGREARGLPDERAVAELLGAINYLASAIILIRERGE